MQDTSILAKVNDLGEGTAHFVTKAKKPKTRLTTVVSVSLEPELAEEAKRVAERYSMTVSGLIRQLLITASVDGVKLTPRKDS